MSVTVDRVSIKADNLTPWTMTVAYKDGESEDELDWGKEDKSVVHCPSAGLITGVPESCAPI